VSNYCQQAWGGMKIKPIASALLLVALGLNSCTKQNTEVKVGSSPSTSADTDVKTNILPTTSADSKLFLFTRNGKYGYIDRTGKIVIPAKLDTPYENSNSVTPVGVGVASACAEASQNENRDRLIRFAQEDHSGNITYEFRYRLGLAGPKPRVEDDYFYGYKERRTGKVIIRPQFRHAADRFSEGLAWIMDERGRVGYIDKQGKLVIPPQYSYSSAQMTHGGASTAYFGSDFNGGLAKVCSGELLGSRKCGYIDRIRKVVIPLKFDEVAEKFSNGLAWVVIKDRRGYIDKTGKVKIPAKFKKHEWNVMCDSTCLDAKADFDRGLAAVRISKTCGSSDGNDCDRSAYIDTTGKLVFEF
jgi:hypothetical protein